MKLITKFKISPLSISTSNLNSWLIVLLIFSFPLIGLLNYLLDIRTGTISYALRGFNALTSLLIIINFFSLKKHKVKPVFILLIGFWILYIVRLVIDLEYYEIHEGTGSEKSYYYLYALLITFLPMVAAGLIYPIDFDKIISHTKKLLVVFNVAILILYIKELFWGEEPVYRFYLKTKDFDFLNPITIGVYAALLLFISFFNSKKSKWDYLWILISFINLYSSGSRGPILFFILILIIVVIVDPNRFFKSRNDLILKLVGIIIVSVSIVAVLLNNSAFVDRITNFSGDQSSKIRLSILDDAKHQLSTNPFTGSHFLVVESKAYSHNMLIDVFLSNGILGALLFIPILFLFFKLIIKSKLQSTFIIITLFLFLNTLTSGAIYNSYEFWIAFSLLLASYNNITKSNINFFTK